MTPEDFSRDNLCFVCGAQNEGGLRLHPSSGDGRAHLDWTPAAQYQGYANVLHGGIISTLLDEVMAHAVLSRFQGAPTAEIQVRFLKPVQTEVPLRITAEIIGARRRVITATAELVQEGEVRARATARFIAALES